MNFVNFQVIHRPLHDELKSEIQQYSFVKLYAHDSWFHLRNHINYVYVSSSNDRDVHRFILFDEFEVAYT
jgi:hypothetical protein